MNDDARIQQLLDELLTSHGTPEAVCESCPELLPVVRNRWLQMCRVRANLDELFPAADEPTPQAPSNAELPRIPGYEVQAVLGRGGAGVVFKARHLALKRAVAIKMLAVSHFRPEDRDRFRAEAEAVARLQHPNIVQIHEIGEADGGPFLAFEFVEGGSLAERLAGRSLPARDAARLVVALAEAMHLAHSRNLVHRDLKPGNVLLAGAADAPVSQWQPKVADFGLARVLDADSTRTQVGMVLGTPSYMAPEQAEGSGHRAGPAADVWALGAILYECLTGRPPFRGATGLETLMQVRNLEPVAPSTVNHRVPRDLETVCLKCLRKLPEQRYPSARELADDLGRFVRGEPVIARPVGAARRLGKWLQRRPAMAGLLFAAVLLVMTGGCAAWLLSEEAARQSQTDQEVGNLLSDARGRLEQGWQQADVAQITEACAKGNRAEAVAHSGGASAVVREQVEAFQQEAGARLERAHKNRRLREALLDVSLPHESNNYPHNQAGHPLVLCLASLEQQYAAAFRRWGLDLDATAEAEVVQRLAAEPDPVVQEVIAALDNWMLERRNKERPEADWKRLFRVADQLDRNPRHRQLRALLLRLAPRPATGAARQPFADPGRLTVWRELLELRTQINPRTDPALTVVLLARALHAAGDDGAAERLLIEATTVRPDQVALLVTLGVLLEARGPGRLADAIGYYRAARSRQPGLGIALCNALLLDRRGLEAEELVEDLTRLEPGNPWVSYYRGLVLHMQKNTGAAEVAFRKAVDLKPDFAEAHSNLGCLLANQNQLTAAEAAFRKAIDLKPDFAEAHNNLGKVLYRLGRFDRAATMFSKAIELWPQFAEAYHNLGLTLSQQDRPAAAEVAFRVAVELGPDHAEAYYNLGNALTAQGKHAEAVAVFRKAVDLDPDLPQAHYNLGLALVAQGKVLEAEPAFRKAIELRSDFAGAYFNLGNILLLRGKYTEAETAYREATARLPDFAEAHRGLGYALLKQQKAVAAERALREATKLKSGFALAQYQLGVALMEQAKFDEAGAELMTAGDLFPAKHPGREQASQLRQQCRRFADLDAQLPAILAGTKKPASAIEYLEFARVCHLKRLYAAAADFYTTAFTMKPQWAEDHRNGHRYHAACSAALAGCGHGEDAAGQGAAARERLRKQALAWLRADLAAWSQWLAGDPAARRMAVQKALAQWQQTAELACVRDGAELDRLDADERLQYAALWAEWDAVLARTEK
jgi:serine/threonine-protein kinase